MNSIINNVCEACEEIKNNLVGHKCVVLGGCAVYIDGYSGILSFNDTMVELATKSGTIHIEGEGLYLKQITKQDIIVKGHIESVNVFETR